MFKNHIIISLLLLSIGSIAQTNPATARRDWYVGYYRGVLKDSSNNITVPCSFSVYWTENHPNFPYPLDDSTVTIPSDGGWRYVVCADSTIQVGGNRFCTNWPNSSAYGMLKADSSLYLVYQSSGGCVCSATVGSPHCNPGHIMTFHGKKISNTPISVYEHRLENSSAAVFPNPAQEHLNVLTFVEFDVMELYDILGKNYEILINKTSNGYHIDLPENMSSGIYFLRMRKGNESITKKVFIKLTE